MENDEFAFTLEEVGDLFKSKKNILFLLNLRGKIIRLLFTATRNVYTDVSEGRVEWQKKTVKNSKNLHDTASSEAAGDRHW